MIILQYSDRIVKSIAKKILKKSCNTENFIFLSQTPVFTAFRRTAGCFWKALHADDPTAVRTAFPDAMRQSSIFRP